MALLKLAILYLGFCITSVLSGCCNENYWCDGDPSFREQPMASQPLYSTEVTISWSEAYLNLVKCVDYFIVRQAAIANGSDITLRSGLNFTNVPVTIALEEKMDDWEDSISPMLNHYIAKFVAAYDTDYVIKVFAVDKGAGWGEHEGRAVVEADEILFHSRPYMAPPPAPDPVELLRERINQRYPPTDCHQHRMCEELAREWIDELTGYIGKFSLPYQDPKPLPPIEVANGDGSKRYDVGQLHRLSRFEANLTGLGETPGGRGHVANVTVKFKMLRTSYVWHSFFSYGVLSLYHTCGRKLPTAIFDDVDEDEVEAILDPDCWQEVQVQFKVPFFATDGLPVVEVAEINLARSDFKYDTTWFTSHFHNLTGLWLKQRPIIEDKIEVVVKQAFEMAVQQNQPPKWLKKKYELLDEEIKEAIDIRDDVKNGTANANAEDSSEESGFFNFFNSDEDNR